MLLTPQKNFTMPQDAFLEPPTSTASSGTALVVPVVASSPALKLYLSSPLILQAKEEVARPWVVDWVLN